MSVGLPPIPSLGEEDPNHDPGGTDLVSLLLDEHRAIDRLRTAVAGEADPARRRAMSDVLVAMISRHLSAEEQYLYPAVRAALPEGADLARAGIRTDRQLHAALAGSPADAAGGTPEMPAAWHRHRQFTESELLPRLRTAATAEELIRLGNRAAIAEEAAPTRPHPRAPEQPPWNRVAAPALGLVDKVRDLVTGRTTYPQDLSPSPGEQRRDSSGGDR
ncbi:hemerythrin domain-containing protein [Micromonospora sp. LOL_023]|uniref:hemerythrin domain-containing protein n=1 Tax=Micromonospora sp. LOL_023 TaxID=3345418 RepID=UPI003A8AFAA2